MSREDSASPPEEAPSRDVVDPLIRAHIYSLCTALGGASVEQTGIYTLGDDALSCLKDLRRWLKLYDQKLNRYDVARCLSEMNLVGSDLLEIIGMWKEEDMMVKWKHRTVVACIELLVPLTWPFEKNNEYMTKNHHRHIPVLQYAQAGYKAAILQHRSGKILKDIIRAGLPAMAVPQIDRGDRDEGLIKLILYLIRNVALIEHPTPNENDTGEEINRSATINVFAEQNVFDLLLTISSGIADDFRLQDGVVMEAIYHIVKGVDVESIFRSDEEESKKRGKDLTLLLKMEDDMKRVNSRTAPTRHNRFGTTVWMERTDGTRSFVSGQDALLGKATGLEKFDKSKKWKKPRGADSKGVSQKTDLDMKVTLNASARKHLRKFVEEFIDSGFNPLFQSIRRAIDRDVDRLLNSHLSQCFFLVAWFLEAERIRKRMAAKDKKNPSTTTTQDGNFGIVAAVLNQEFLITLNRKMVGWYDLKLWNELQPGMRCYTQILHTVQDMALSPIEDDQDIAENIQNRLFYEEITMDLIYNICRSYTKQPFKWLDDCTEMVHVHLKLLEKYSQQHEHMFVRSRKRQSKKKKDQAHEAGEASDGEENDEEMAAASKRAVAERAFDFSRFEMKYLNQNCINTFIALLRYYKELDSNQIMRAIKMFHRIFEKIKMEVLLYRLDLVDLLHQMMQGSEALAQSHPAYKQVDQFSKHFLRKMFKKLEMEPALYVELLFTKVDSTAHYLQHGYDKEVRVPRSRAAAELYVKPSAGMSHRNQVGVAVGALLDGNKSDYLEWLKDVFKKAVYERKLWEDEAEARRALEREGSDPDAPAPETPAAIGEYPDILVNPVSDELKTAMFKDGYLRCLLSLMGCEKMDVIETPNTKWIIPGKLNSQVLTENLTLLQQYANEPPVYEGGKVAADFLGRKLEPRRKRQSELSSDNDTGASDSEMLFEPGGPTAMKPLHEKEKKEANRKKRPRVEAEGDLDELLLERRRKREERERAALAKIKSSLFVTASDDEDDEEADRLFFEREAQIKSIGPQTINAPPMLGKGRSVEMDTDDELEDSQPTPKRRKEMKKSVGKRKNKAKGKMKKGESIFGTRDSESGSEGGDENDSMSRDSSEEPRERNLSRPKEAVFTDDENQRTWSGVSRSPEKGALMLDEDDNDEVPISRPAQRRRAVVSSDSDE